MASALVEDPQPSVAIAAEEPELDTRDRISVMLHDCLAEFRSEEGAAERFEATSSLAKEAQDNYHEGKYEVACEGFTRYLAAVMCDPMAEPDSRASLLSNIGACLHHLDEDELAQKYYTKALATFENECVTPRFTWLFYGDINQKRIDFIKGRLDTLSKKQKPARGKYLDSSGNEMEWIGPSLVSPAASTSAAETEDTGVLSYVNPFAWYRYLAGVPEQDHAVGVGPEDPPSASAPSVEDAV